MKVNSNEERKGVNEVDIPLVGSDKPNSTKKLKDGTTSSPGAIFVLINAALGAGLLTFPHAFWSSGGVAVGLLLQAVRM